MIKAILKRSAISTKLTVANFKLTIWISINRISLVSLIKHRMYKEDSPIRAKKIISLLIKDLLNFNIDYNKIRAKMIEFIARVIGRRLFQARFIKRS